MENSNEENQTRMEGIYETMERGIPFCCGLILLAWDNDCY